MASRIARKDEMAKAAAPYLHPRLVASDEKDEEPVQYSMDLTKLSDDELIAFERMLIKAHRPVVLPPPIDLEVEDECTA
jgi:hypothetical protein